MSNCQVLRLQTPFLFQTVSVCDKERVVIAACIAQLSKIQNGS